jgi:hypothetical protein
MAHKCGEMACLQANLLAFREFAGPLDPGTIFPYRFPWKSNPNFKMGFLNFSLEINLNYISKNLAISKKIRTQITSRKLKIPWDIIDLPFSHPWKLIASKIYKNIINFPLDINIKNT